jgi:peptide/nickel transport system permease protein
MGLGRFVGRRLLGAVILTLAAAVLNFLLIHAAPGDPALMLAGEAGGTSEETLRAIRVSFGLDRPLPVQLLVYLGALARGDLGFSYFYRQSVVGLILDRLPATLLLAATALGLAWVVGVASGVLAARRPRALCSNVLSVVSLVGFAMPAFWTAIMLLLLFSVDVEWFPTHGMTTIGLTGGPAAHALDVARHLVLPAVSLAVIFVAVYSRLTRASMMDALVSDFVRTARAKGLGEPVILVKHALRNALLPVVTIAGIQVGQVLAGAILIETVFSWPGMGRLAFESILRRDYPLLLGILLFSSVAVIVTNLVTDVVYGVLDPRIRHR